MEKRSIEAIMFAEPAKRAQCLKQQAGRAQDLLDIDKLKALRKESNGD